jgi:hypothetical protein
VAILFGFYLAGHGDYLQVGHMIGWLLGSTSASFLFGYLEYR